jgi:pterin-4a-carbinolamine dehydratase
MNASDPEVRGALVKRTDWRVETAGDREQLVREAIFRDFDSAKAFQQRVADAAVDHLRRPDMCISEFNHVRLRIANPNGLGLTLAEVRLAEKVDAVVGDGAVRAT